MTTYSHMSVGLYTLCCKKYTIQPPTIIFKVDFMSDSSNFWYSYSLVNTPSRSDLFSNLTRLVYVPYLGKLQDREHFI